MNDLERVLREMIRERRRLIREARANSWHESVKQYRAQLGILEITLRAAGLPQEIGE